MPDADEVIQPREDIVPPVDEPSADDPGADAGTSTDVDQALEEVDQAVAQLDFAVDSKMDVLADLDPFDLEDIDELLNSIEDIPPSAAHIKEPAEEEDLGPAPQDELDAEKKAAPAETLPDQPTAEAPGESTDADQESDVVAVSADQATAVPDRGPEPAITEGGQRGPATSEEPEPSIHERVGELEEPEPSGDPLVSASSQDISDGDITDLDGELAGDVEELLEGEIDPTEAILEDVYDEKAAIVDEAPIDAESLDDELSEAVQTATFQDEAVAESQAFGDDSAETDPEPNSEPAGEITEPPALDQEADARANEESPAESPKPTPVAASVAAGEIDTTDAGDPTGSPQWLRVGQTVVSLLRPLIRPAFAALSLPMRFVPPSRRFVVDWIAVSLAFWVPIIWFVAVFMIG